MHDDIALIDRLVAEKGNKLELEAWGRMRTSSHEGFTAIPYEEFEAWCHRNSMPNAVVWPIYSWFQRRLMNRQVSSDGSSGVGAYDHLNKMQPLMGVVNVDAFADGIVGANYGVHRLVSALVRALQRNGRSVSAKKLQVFIEEGC